MRPVDRQLVRGIIEKLYRFDQQVTSLPGIGSSSAANTLALQIVDSIRRVKYIETIRDRQGSNIYIDTSSSFFDPFKAAAWYKQNGYINDAFWMIFLGTHFGKNKSSGWSLAKEVFKGSPTFGKLTWQTINSHFNSFRTWLQNNLNTIKASGNFGNHRKYQSLDAYSPTGTGAAIGSYLDWVGPYQDHSVLLSGAISVVGNSRRSLFDYLYKSMEQVISFGRTAKFDYLTMIGKFQLADIEPGFTYMNGATGPKRGAKLLFGGNINAQINDQDLNLHVSKLEEFLNLYFGMQVLEDSLCNWQKSPSYYIHFSG